MLFLSLGIKPFNSGKCKWIAYLLQSERNYNHERESSSTGLCNSGEDEGDLTGLTQKSKTELDSYI